jgi:MGT family glycosyltransferase
MDALRYYVQHIGAALLKPGLQHLPKVLTETGVEALVIDVTFRHLQLVAMHLGIPFANVWNALHIDTTGTTPPCLFDFPYDPSPEGRARNIAGLKVIGELGASQQKVAAAYAEAAGLKFDWSSPYAAHSQLAILTQAPREFDFPGTPWPEQFHYAGPFHDGEGREPVPFAWEKLTGKPLIYASMGTLVNGIEDIYRTILQTVGKLSDVQMVLSVGRHVKREDLGPIPLNTIVVPAAPQIELLKHAELCITHAGLNTTLETLASGVPMVAIPISFDQPGVAARIAYHGVGEFLSLDDLTSEALSALIQKVRANPAYKSKALYFQKVIAQTRGLDIAADVLEEAFGKVLTHSGQSHA